MQPYTTPLPGRTPGYITNKDWYKLQVTVRQLPDGQQHLTIRRWAPEMGWRTTELFLTLDELELFKRSLDGTRQG